MSVATEIIGKFNFIKQKYESVVGRPLSCSELVKMLAIDYELSPSDAYRIWRSVRKSKN
ncbi:MAG: hypothetical protein J7L12_04645 [Desulfurococcales archaeon]|nr:hypothetical protein [Desulfurococcales archaeon]